ncbi:MAG: hypothetical protein WB729_21410, partial [Candidatus Sulfotelmatobacter sp.]
GSFGTASRKIGSEGGDRIREATAMRLVLRNPRSRKTGETWGTPHTVRHIEGEHLQDDSAK